MIKKMFFLAISSIAVFLISSNFISINSLGQSRLEESIRVEDNKLVVDMVVLVPLMVVAGLILLLVIFLLIKKSGHGYIKTTPAKLA